MRVFVAFTAGLITAAILIALPFLIEGLFNDVGLTCGTFVFGVVMIFLVGVPVLPVGALPIWIVFRKCGVYSPWAFGLAGACLALIYYLFLVALGLGAPSDRPMTFWENLGRGFHAARITFSIFAGAGGALTFWLIAVKRSVGTGRRSIVVISTDVAPTATTSPEPA